MARGKKTPPEVIYQIMASWAVTNNFSETARTLNLPMTTVEKVVKENKDKPEFVKVCEEGKALFSKRATQIIDKGMELLERRFDRALEQDEKLDIRAVTAVISTLYDKRALSLGESTENTTVHIKLPQEMNEYAE